VLCLVLAIRYVKVPESAPIARHASGEELRNGDPNSRYGMQAAQNSLVANEQNLDQGNSKVGIVANLR
jgi:hypothetical protein